MTQPQTQGQVTVTNQTGPTQAPGLLFIYTETALHAGTGASLGTVDLPIQRERITSFPKVQSSSIKGVLRSLTTSSGVADLLYGPDGQQYAGALAISDARIVLFPVRSLSGLFSWITCPTALARLKRDLELISQPPSPTWKLEHSTFQRLIQGEQAAVAANSGAVVGPLNKIALEEYLFEPVTALTDANGGETGEITGQAGQDEVAEIAKWLADQAFPGDLGWWRDKLRYKNHLVVLTDEDFRDFVISSTEVIARTRLDPGTKTVQSGALWYQEFLPEETLLYSVVVAQDARDPLRKTVLATEVLQQFKSQGINRIQLGGDETTGKGFCKLNYL
jgi:CRISPR-associated protein Cmr4